MSNVVVIGGGVVGLTIAYETARAGAKVKLLERGQIGQEASWAGAGMLPPANLERAVSPEEKLCGLSNQRWPSLTEELRELTGLDNGYHVCGGLELRTSAAADSLMHEVEYLRAIGVRVEELDTDSLRRLEPNVSESAVAGYRLPDFAQVRNPRHLKALVLACSKLGVELVSGQPVLEFNRAEGRVVSVRTTSGVHGGDQFCVATGAWSSQLLGNIADVKVEPVRGQIVLLSSDQPMISHVLQDGARYLVPRRDGRLLIGATEEWVGFNKGNTPGAVADLIEFGASLVSKIRGARFERAWSGLRPRAIDRPPYIGRIPNHDNLFVATGHFRAGLQLSTGTAVVIQQLIAGERCEIDLAEFEVPALSLR